MTAYELATQQLQAAPRTWLVTGVAGFIGSHLLETLLALGQRVRGLDNFATGHRRNLDAAQGRAAAGQVEFIEGDIRDFKTCQEACRGVELVLHQAAMGSVPWSIADPIRAHAVNTDGFLNMLCAAREAAVQGFVYASSSAVYGDDPDLPKVEGRIGQQLSPYALTKRINELYAGVFERCYGQRSIGLRYFNVFGPRQDPNGPYAAVIPLWIRALLRNEPVQINGDGETSRDFCYVANVVQANLLAATATDPSAWNHVYNVALNERTSLNELFATLRKLLAPLCPQARDAQPTYRDFRSGDVRHSLADISHARDKLGYEPTHRLEAGLAAALDWYRATLA